MTKKYSNEEMIERLVTEEIQAEPAASAANSSFSFLPAPGLSTEALKMASEVYAFSMYAVRALFPKLSAQGLMARASFVASIALGVLVDSAEAAFQSTLAADAGLPGKTTPTPTPMPKSGSDNWTYFGFGVLTGTAVTLCALGVCVGIYFKCLWECRNSAQTDERTSFARSVNP